MTKSTKILAGLGVVAALGVSALPLASYATESVSGNVQLAVEVLPAIAMTIKGNNDDHSHYNDGSTSYASVDTFSPAGVAEGEVDGHEIPAAAVNGTSSSWTSILPNAVVEGGTFKSTVTVYTNNYSGYDLTVIDSDTTTALTGSNAGTIPVIAGAAEGELEAGTAAWGYRVGTSGDWLAMPASTGTAAAIGSESVKTEDGTAYTVEYGVATASDQATGVYTDTIVYTATTK